MDSHMIELYNSMKFQYKTTLHFPFHYVILIVYTAAEKSTILDIATFILLCTLNVICQDYNLHLYLQQPSRIWMKQGQGCV